MNFSFLLDAKYQNTQSMDKDEDGNVTGFQKQVDHQKTHFQKKNWMDGKANI